MQSVSPHQLAFEGNFLALQSLPCDDRFHSLSVRDHTVLYSACRSKQPSTQLVKYLIETKMCDVNLPNGEAAACSFPQHAVVQTLFDALNGPTTLDPNFAVLSLQILGVLKQCGANMAATNKLGSTALEEFQRFEYHLKAFEPTSHLVPYFLKVLSPEPLNHSPYYAEKPQQLPHEQHGACGSQ
jgi:hypothetical protein